MTRLFFIALLLVSSGPAYGEWELVIGNEQSQRALYLETDSIRRKGSMVKLWELMDFKTPEKG